MGGTGQELGGYKAGVGGGTHRSWVRDTHRSVVGGGGGGSVVPVVVGPCGDCVRESCIAYQLPQPLQACKS